MHINMDWGRLLLSVDGRGCEEVLVCMVWYCKVWYGMVWCDVYAYTIYMVWFLSVSQELTNLKLSPITRRSSFCKSLSISNYRGTHRQGLRIEANNQWDALSRGWLSVFWTWTEPEWKSKTISQLFMNSGERDAEHFQDPEIYFRRCYKYISRQKQCVVPSHWRGLDQTLHKETVKRPKRKPWIIFDKVKRSLGLKTMTAS